MLGGLFFHSRCLIDDLCVSGRAVFTVEMYLQTERVLIVGAETQETQHDWIQALTKVALFVHTHTNHAYFLLLELVFFHLKLQRSNALRS